LRVEGWGETRADGAGDLCVEESLHLRHAKLEAFVSIVLGVATPHHFDGRFGDGPVCLEAEEALDISLDQNKTEQTREDGVWRKESEEKEAPPLINPKPSTSGEKEAWSRGAGWELVVGAWKQGCECLLDAWGCAYVFHWKDEDEHEEFGKVEGAILILVHLHTIKFREWYWMIWRGMKARNLYAVVQGGAAHHTRRHSGKMWHAFHGIDASYLFEDTLQLFSIREADHLRKANVSVYLPIQQHWFGSLVTVGYSQKAHAPAPCTWLFRPCRDPSWHSASPEAAKNIVRWFDAWKM